VFGDEFGLGGSVRLYDGSGIDRIESYVGSTGDYVKVVVRIEKR
jgi:hypothetical protein